MWSLLQIVLPVCGLILLGFLTRYFGLVKANADDIIGDFVFKIAIPILLFRLIATSEFDDINPWAIWGTYFSAISIVWIFSAITIPFIFGREKLYGVIAAVAACFANNLLIGVPVVLQAYGEAGMVSLALLLSIHLPLMLFITIVHHDIAKFLDGTGGLESENTLRRLKRFGMTVIKNPIMIGILAGALMQFVGITLPDLVLDFTGKIAGIAGPLALIVLGMGLQKYGIKGNVVPSFVTSFLKLIVMPGLVLTMGLYVFELPPILLAGIVIPAAAPSGVNTYLFAQQFGTGQALAANAISISTLLSIVSMTFWLGVVAVVVL